MYIFVVSALAKERESTDQPPNVNDKMNSEWSIPLSLIKEESGAVLMESFWLFKVHSGTHMLL